jgi:YD repeat-containing protein
MKTNLRGGGLQLKRLSGAATLLICVALSAPFTRAQTISDWQRDHLLGSVRSVHLEFAEANMVGGKLVEITRRPHQRVSYNERGQEIERVSFKEDGSIGDTSIIRYDSEGRIIGYGDGKKDRYHSILDYDSKGNRIAARSYDSDLLQTRETYTYDDKQRKIEQSRFADSGAYHERITYTYNPAGQLTEMAVYYSQALTQKHLKTYDGGGKLVKEVSISYQSPGQNSTVLYLHDKSGRVIETRVDTEILWSKTQTIYDAKGQVAQRETFMEYKKRNVSQSHAPEPGKIVFRYNDRNQVLEEAFYAPDGALTRKTVSTYNEVGNLIEQFYFNKGSDDVKISYEYDSQGNWVKRMQSDTDHTGRKYMFIQHRTITYY